MKDIIQKIVADLLSMRNLKPRKDDLTVALCGRHEINEHFQCRKCGVTCEEIVGKPHEDN